MSSLKNKLANAKSKLALKQDKLEDHPANLNDHQDGSFFNIDIQLISPNPNQPRKFFNPESLKELSQSIKQKGVLQPVIIRRDDDGKIFLVAGERRFRASKMAGLEKIPAILTKGNPIEIAIIENLQRDNLKPVEEAEALGRLIKEYSYTQEQLSLVISKAQSTISETLSLNKLPKQIKEECRETDYFPRRLLVEVVKQKTEDKMFDLFNKIKEGNLKSGQVRNITREKNKNRTPGAIALEKILTLDNYLSKIDFNTIEENEKSQLMACLEKLKNSIKRLVQ